ARAVGGAACAGGALEALPGRVRERLERGVAPIEEAGTVESHPGKAHHVALAGSAVDVAAEAIGLRSVELPHGHEFPRYDEGLARQRLALRIDQPDGQGVLAQARDGGHEDRGKAHGTMSAASTLRPSPSRML